MVPSQRLKLPPASFQGFRDYFEYGRCQKNVCKPYAFLCYHLYIHEPIILIHFISRSAHGNLLILVDFLNLITALHPKPVNHLPTKHLLSCAAHSIGQKVLFMLAESESVKVQVSRKNRDPSQDCILISGLPDYHP